MSRRITAAFICAVMLLLTGCSLVTDGEYTDSSAHVPSGTEEPEAERTVEVSNYSQLYDEILGLVQDCIEHAAVQFVSYQGDIESDISEVCLSVARDTPIGDYAVYYIDYNVNKIVSYYEADVTVSYRRTQEEIESLFKFQDTETLEESLRLAMENREEHTAFLVEDGQVSLELVESLMEQAYYDNPGTILYFPKYSISFYPEEGDEYIVDVTLSFPYTASTAASRLQQMNLRAEEIISSVDQTVGVSDQVRQLCGILSQAVTFDEERANSDNYSRWYSSFTAYGALVNGRAAGEGYAMALKLMCDKMGIECIVVRGSLDGRTHAWNLVRLENGELYHVDSSMYQEDRELFWNDSQIGDSYSWDTSAYPECSGPSLYSTTTYSESGTEPGTQEPAEIPPEPETPEEPQDPSDDPVEEPGEGDITPETPPEDGGESGNESGGQTDGT